MKVFFDGGCRPTGMEWAVVIGGRGHVERGLGYGSSMAAEWLALIAAMTLAREEALVAPVLLGDALAVIAQANGVARCPVAHLAQLSAFAALRREVGPCRVRYLKRSQNLAGILLARR